MIASVLSFSLMPFLVTFFLSFKLAITFPPEMINLLLLFSIVSVIASLLDHSLYAKLSTTAWVIRLESHMESLV